VLAVAVLIFLAHDKIRVQKRDVNRKHDDRNRLNDLGGWELVLLLMPIPLRASLDALFTGYFKGSKILKPNTVGIAISRCRC
jgi:hypothetical protein